MSHPETEGEKETRIRKEKIAKKQFEAAERGHSAAQSARIILDKLSRNA